MFSPEWKLSLHLPATSFRNRFTLPTAKLLPACPRTQHHQRFFRLKCQNFSLARLLQKNQKHQSSKKSFRQIEFPGGVPSPFGANGRVRLRKVWTERVNDEDEERM